MFLKKQGAQFRQDVHNSSETFSEEEQKSESSRFRSNQEQGNNQGSSHCQFCLSNNVIMSQLGRLKQIVIDKNQKIKELQEFIQRLSRMMFNSSGKINQLEMMEIVKSVGEKREMESDQSGQQSETASLNNSKGQLTFYDLNKQMRIIGKHNNQQYKQEQEDHHNHSRSKVQHMNPSKQFPSSSLQIKRINSQSTKPLIHSLLPFLPIPDHHQSITTQSQPHHQGMIGQIHAIVKPHNKQNQSHRDMKSSTASLKVLSKRSQI